MIQSQKSIRRGLIVAGVGVLAIGAIAYGVGSRNEPSGRTRDTAIPVTVAIAEAKDFPIAVGAVGTVQASNKAEVRAQVAGTIQRIAFHEGQTVHAGDLLAEIDARPYQAALSQAQAMLARDQASLLNARQDLQRAADLSVKGFIAGQQLDARRSTVGQLEAIVKGGEAAVDKARTDLSYTRIAAPIDGITGLRTLDVGNVVRPSDVAALASIMQIQPVTVVFTLPAEHLVQILRQMSKGALPTEARDQKGKTVLAEGTLSAVDNEVDQKTGSVRLKALFSNADRTLWPGAFVSVKLTTEVHRGGITVPAKAVQHGAEGIYIFVAVPDDHGPAGKSDDSKSSGARNPGFKAELRLVKLIDQQGDVVLLEEGVQAGEKVIVDGQMRLASGTKVRIVTPDGTPQHEQENSPAWAK